MAQKPYHVIGLDLGTHETRALVCRRNEKGKLSVAGLGVAESKGWRRDVMANLDLSVLAVKKAVAAAEAASGVPIESAYVGVGGTYVKGVSSRGAAALHKTPRPNPEAHGTPEAREVTREDVRKAIRTAQGISLPLDRELLHVLPQEFSIDSQGGIRDPLGMVGARLEASVHVVTASATATQNVVTAVNRAGIVVLDTVFEPLASAEACLTTDERELGVALLDIGAGSTGIVVYGQGTVRHSAVIPVGGDHFTNDIAVGVRTPIPEAEKMKRIWGERDSAQAVLEVQSVGDRPAHVVSYALLGEIIEPRAVELLELVQAELARSGCAEQLGAGVVMAGGSVKLGGLPALAEQVLGLPTRIGIPRGLDQMGEVLPDPAFAVVAGLVTYGNRMRLLRDSSEGNFMDKLRKFFLGTESSENGPRLGY